MSACLLQAESGPCACFVSTFIGPGAADRAIYAAPLAPEHQRHLIDPANHKLVCACRRLCACSSAAERDGPTAHVPRRGQRSGDFRLTDEPWDEPVPAHRSGVFLFQFAGGAGGRHVSRARPGPPNRCCRSRPGRTWKKTIRPGCLEPDVEALLVNRLGAARGVFPVPIDECYGLVGLIRTRWRGLSGGTEVWRGIGEFFEDLQRTEGGQGAVCA